MWLLHYSWVLKLLLTSRDTTVHSCSVSGLNEGKRLSAHPRPPPDPLLCSDLLEMQIWKPLSLWGWGWGFPTAHWMGTEGSPPSFSWPGPHPLVKSHFSPLPPLSLNSPKRLIPARGVKEAWCSFCRAGRHFCQLLAGNWQAGLPCGTEMGFTSGTPSDSHRGKRPHLTVTKGEEMRPLSNSPECSPQQRPTL